jgi:hypothetical protein
MSTGFTVDAYYAPKLDMKRQAQINAVLEKYGVRVAVHTLHEDGTITGGSFSELCWDCGEDGKDTDVEIYVPGEEHSRGDPLQRARRFAAELQFCGMETRVSVAA